MPAMADPRLGERKDETMDENDPPPRRRHRLDPLPLDDLGVAELTLYIRELRAEITRAEAAIDRRQAHRAAVDRFFKAP